MEEGVNCDALTSEGRQSVEHDDGYGVIEQRLAKDDTVQSWIYLLGIEDGQDRYWIRSAESRSEDEAFE